MKWSAGQEHPVVFRTLKFTLFIAFGVLFTSTAVGLAKVGDWEFRVQGEDAATEIRVALTAARLASSSTPKPNLLIRRKESDSPIELLIIDTHDKEKDKCDYKEWKVKIDKTEVPVLGYTFEPAKTVLKANWGTPEDKLWDLFRNGLKLAVEVEQKCDSSAGEVNLVNHNFSLRGSNAAYKYVSGSNQ